MVHPFSPHIAFPIGLSLIRTLLTINLSLHATIQNNLFPPHRDIHETYDLKGSSVGREYPEEKARTKKGAVMKDINWVRRDRKIKLGPEKAALFAEQLRRDTEFLKRNRIMDYSLLIGIHNMERGNRDGLRQQSLQVFDVSYRLLLLLTLIFTSNAR
jgi:1-phosphatidylinositol-4-phosphate 5-kinase